jgi:aryl-alcohol dehydrogenase-like predicted oxidoreductase
MDNRRDLNIVSGNLTERTLADVVTQVAGELGHTSAQVALAWTMLHPSVTSPVMGARTAAQLEDNLGSLDVIFSADQIDRLDKAGAIEAPFPYKAFTSPLHGFMFGNVKVEPRGFR